MKDRHIVVVGGGSGIGRGIAQAAHAAGAEVTIVGRTRKKLDDVAGELKGGAAVHVVAANVTEEADVQQLFEAVPHFDHLVSTVADLAYAPIARLEVAAARRSLESKLLSALLLAKHGGPWVREGGSLTFISGVAAYRPMSGGVLVATANGALASMVASLALELAPVRVNAVSPGWIDTPIWDTVAGERKGEVQAQMAARLPVGRIGQPGDIAQAVLSVMGNGFITGTVIHVDGGHRLV